MFKSVELCPFSPYNKKEKRKCPGFDEESATCSGFEDFNYCGTFRRYTHGY
jgi:hypothetical protein